MTIKDIKTFLEKFDENEKIADIIFEKDMDICDGCTDYYCDDYCDNNYYNGCANVDYCQECKKYKNILSLSIAFESQLNKDGCISLADYATLEVKDSD